LYYKNIFYHLCFCVCAPQAPYPKISAVVAGLKSRNFFGKHIPLAELRKIVRPVRFLRKAAYLQDLKRKWKQGKLAWIVKGRDKAWLSSFQEGNQHQWEKAREKLVETIKGLGMKTASHFLRNMGCQDFAIIDTHILKYMGAKSPRNPREYLALEKTFQNMSQALGLKPAMVDAIVWKQYSGTPWQEFQY